MSLSIEEIVGIFKKRGTEMYGSEAVNQLEHALQCATLAEKAGAQPELITAALLHDLGHLIHGLGDDAAEQGVDDIHQYIALPFIRPLFSDKVIDPIRMHVEAKRYLCATDPDYWGALSPASKHSLELQGGIYSAEEAREFIALPNAHEALALRRWDDSAKVAGLKTPGITHFANIMHACTAQTA